MLVIVCGNLMKLRDHFIMLIICSNAKNRYNRFNTTPISHIPNI